MGDLIDLAARRRTRRPSADAAIPAQPGPVELFFDLGSPSAYLVAERADRMLTSVSWQPVLAPAGWQECEDRASVEHRAAELAMPLVWPDARWGGGRPAMRVAQFAAEHGRGGSFAVAAGRLAYCGGFDLDEPWVLAEAAAAAHLDVDGAMHASADRTRDAELLRAGRQLGARGASQLPAFGVGPLLLCGERSLAAAAAAARAGTAVSTA